MKRIKYFILIFILGVSFLIPIFTSKLKVEAYTLIGGQYDTEWTVIDETTRNPDGRILFYYNGYDHTFSTNPIVDYNYNLTLFYTTTRVYKNANVSFYYDMSDTWYNFNLFTNQGLLYNFNENIVHHIIIRYDSDPIPASVKFIYNFYDRDNTLLYSIHEDTLTVSGITNLYLTSDENANYGDGFNSGFDAGIIAGKDIATLETALDIYHHGFADYTSLSATLNNSGSYPYLLAGNNNYNNGVVSTVIDIYRNGFNDYGYVLNPDTNPQTPISQTSSQPYLEGRGDGYENGVISSFNSGFDGKTINNQPINDSDSFSYSNGLIVGEAEAYQHGFVDGGNKSFQADLKNWIVPAIIITLLLGGAITLISRKREN